MKLCQNREIWIDRVSNYKSSNLTPKVWCEKNGLKVNTFRYWLKKLDEKPDTPSDISSSSGFEFASVSISQEFAPTVYLKLRM